ncbi:hypothetical protein CRG98_034883 [Punica granatum]|uniref:Uncharacterized protein n=1 Tax=Punica granatum TaxID=22663 RepID=A0A2I0IMW2_PUNGR|nr:hypothetical protein CRG98_034883 [Punica granatum]
MTLLEKNMGAKSTSSSNPPYRVDPPLLPTPVLQARVSSSTTGYKAKIDFPRFDCGNPRSWDYHYEKYLVLNQIAEAHKVDMATIYLDDKADEMAAWGPCHSQGYQLDKSSL